jgi:hypothetical protein
MTVKLLSLPPDTSGPSVYQHSGDADGMIHHHLFHALDDGRKITIRVLVSDLARWLKVPSLSQSDPKNVRDVLLRQPSVMEGIERSAQGKRSDPLGRIDLSFDDLH